MKIEKRKRSRTTNSPREFLVVTTYLKAGLLGNDVPGEVSSVLSCVPYRFDNNKELIPNDIWTLKVQTAQMNLARPHLWGRLNTLRLMRHQNLGERISLDALERQRSDHSI